MSTTYRILIHASSAKARMLMELIEGDADIRMVSMSDINDPEPLAKAPPAPARAPAPTEPAPAIISGKRITGDQLVLEVLRSGPADMAELRRAFINQKFAKTSAGQYVSRAMKAGKIVRGRGGRYSLSSTGNGREATP